MDRRSWQVLDKTLFLKEPSPTFGVHCQVSTCQISPGGSAQCSGPVELLAVENPTIIDNGAPHDWFPAL